MHTVDQIKEIISKVSYPEFTFKVESGIGGRIYVVIAFEATCSKSGQLEKWRSRKWDLSVHMTKSEIVQTCFAACLMALEHEAREKFHYKGQAIFGPHFDVDKLVWLCSLPDAEDVRQAS
jgi:hypothetical protein